MTLSGHGLVKLKKLNLREQGLGHKIPLKTAAIEYALDRATIRLGIYTLIANI